MATALAKKTKIEPGPVEAWLEAFVAFGRSPTVEGLMSLFNADVVVVDSGLALSCAGDKVEESIRKPWSHSRSYDPSDPTSHPWQFDLHRNRKCRHASRRQAILGRLLRGHFDGSQGVALPHLRGPHRDAAPVPGRSAGFSRLHGSPGRKRSRNQRRTLGTLGAA